MSGVKYLLIWSPRNREIAVISGSFHPPRTSSLLFLNLFFRCSSLLLFCCKQLTLFLFFTPSSLCNFN